MKCAVIVFAGSNCDRDALCALRRMFSERPVAVWHQESELPAGVDLVFLPGGFSHGDYLRPGAIAARSPIISAVLSHARSGGYVLGVCNGFQVLTETGLLPGSLIRNSGLTFVCRRQRLIVHRQTAFTCSFAEDWTILPIAHLHGNFRADRDCLDRLTGDGRIALSYPRGDNPNGSARDIAGIVSANGRVFGTMPHPERAVDPVLGGGSGGAEIFRSVHRAHVSGAVSV